MQSQGAGLPPLGRISCQIVQDFKIRESFSELLDQVCRVLNAKAPVLAGTILVFVY